MFAIFQKLIQSKSPIEELVESEDDDATDKEDEDMEIFDIFNKPLEVQQWGENMIVSYHFKSIRDVGAYLSTWCFNRKLDKDHKNKIKKALLASPHPHLLGTIQLIRDKQKKCKVINGQHRIASIQEIIDEDIDMKFDMKVMFEVYDINIDDLDDIDNNSTIEDIFKIANNSLNFKPIDDHDILCQQIVIHMLKDDTLKKGIVDKAEGRVNKPRISTKELYEQFKEHLKSSNLTLTIPEIIIKIKKINLEISKVEHLKLFGRNNPSEKKLRQLAKARELGFYLNMECKMSIDKSIGII